MTAVFVKRRRLPAVSVRRFWTDELRLTGRAIELRPFRPEDLTARYCSWLNDPEVNRFLECRHVRATIPALKKYVAAARRNPGVCFFAIIERSSGEHIGNIKLESAVSPMWENSVGDIGILIGEKKCWGKGYATEAIRLLARFAFRRLGLHKVTAQCLAVNTASIRAFQKAGFTEILIRRSNARVGDRYVDLVLLGWINPAHRDAT